MKFRSRLERDCCGGNNGNRCSHTSYGTKGGDNMLLFIDHLNK